MRALPEKRKGPAMRSWKRLFRRNELWTESGRTHRKYADEEMGRAF